MVERERAIREGELANNALIARLWGAARTEACHAALRCFRHARRLGHPRAAAAVARLTADRRAALVALRERSELEDQARALAAAIDERQRRREREGRAGAVEGEKAGAVRAGAAAVADENRAGPSNAPAPVLNLDGVGNESLEF